MLFRILPKTFISGPLPKPNKTGKKYYLLMLIAMTTVYLFYTFRKINGTDRYRATIVTSVTHNLRYLVNTSNCKIPDIDPFNKDVIPYVFKEKYEACTNLGLLTYIDKSSGFPILKINTSLLPVYSILKITCCYSNITRIDYEKDNDNKVTFSTCSSFEESVNIYNPFIRVICSNNLKSVYTNVHATTLPLKKKKEIRNSTNRKKFSVLFIGIDSMSKLNLRRTMPKTYEYLEKYFTSLNGYNKIGDNTFPNLMALLTGHSKAQLDKFCNTKVKLNYCNMIWDSFRNSEYITAYAEDECYISTFNLDRPGFLDPPTDYYYHPYVVAYEKLPKKRRYSMTYCAGPETSGERILNIVKDFSVTFKNVPNFGLFWMNSFSHDNFNLPAAMDERILEVLNDTNFKESLYNTILVFFSDHGSRFGNFRYTHTGWLEERLPFIYFYIPDTFRKLFPAKYGHFLINSQRLTSPYDLHNTLQDILQMGNETFEATKSGGCPKCHSLFEEVLENRTCKDAAIDQHWCTCTGHTDVNPKGTLVQLVAKFVVKEVNEIIITHKEGRRCVKYDIKRVITAGMSASYLNENNQTVHYFLIIVETKPPASFEATIEAYFERKHSRFQLLGDISRIDRYSEHSYCVKSGHLKKYCYCDDFKRSIKRFICNMFAC